MTDAPVLDSRQRKRLRGLAHGLDPVVHVGAAGLTDASLREVTIALQHHELIKVRLHSPEDRKALAAEVAERSSAALCGLIGHVAILYRPNPDRPRIDPGPGSGAPA